MTRAPVVTAFALLSLLAIGVSVSAQPRETLGVVTEIKVGAGRAEIRRAGDEWRPAGPLQALREGDQVRALGDASVVVLLSSGRGTVNVDAKNSPLVIARPSPPESKLGKAWTMVAHGVQSLTTGFGETPKAVIVTRALGRAPEILTPRNGPMLPDSLVFEWIGTRGSRYIVRVLGPSGVVLPDTEVRGARFQYPPAAPPLQPGVPYRFQVIAIDQQASETAFEVVDATRAQAVENDLRAIDAALSPSASANSLAVARVAVLADGGFFHDARLAVVVALARDPDQPVLHTLLGSLYMQTGLPRQAAESFDEADFLLKRNR